MQLGWIFSERFVFFYVNANAIRERLNRLLRGIGNLLLIEGIELSMLDSLAGGERDDEFGFARSGL